MTCLLRITPALDLRKLVGGLVRTPLCESTGEVAYEALSKVRGQGLPWWSSG